MLILGLDLALSCGWCLLRDAKLEACGLFRVRAPNEGRVAEVRWERECRRLEAWSEWLANARDWASEVSAIVYEAPNPATMKSLAHVESFGALRGLLVCELGLVAPIHRLMPSEVKKWSTGSGRASKDEVREAVNRAFDLDLHADDHDVSDAVATAWAYHQKRQANAA